MRAIAHSRSRWLGLDNSSEYLKSETFFPHDTCLSKIMARVNLDWAVIKDKGIYQKRGPSSLHVGSASTLAPGQTTSLYGAELPAELRQVRQVPSSRGEPSRCSRDSWANNSLGGAALAVRPSVRPSCYGGLTLRPSPLRCLTDAARDHG